MSNGKKRSLVGQKISCSRKVRYHSEAAAKHFGDKVNLRAYPCPICKQYHLTSEGTGGYYGRKYKAGSR